MVCREERAMLRGRHWVIKDAHGAVHAEVPRNSPGKLALSCAIALCRLLMMQFDQ